MGSDNFTPVSAMDRARRFGHPGMVVWFTGISSPYEPPVAPELTLRTDHESIEQCLIRLQECIERRLRHGPDVESVGALGA